MSEGIEGGRDRSNLRRLWAKQNLDCRHVDCGLCPRIPVLEKMTRPLSIRLRLPQRRCIVVLNGSENNPINRVLRGYCLFNYSASEVSVWVRPAYLLRLARWTLRYGMAQARLIALLATVRAHAVICMEQSDRQNTLRSVSYALPRVRIISIQQSRNFEAPHPFGSWGNAKNVRLLVWGDELARDVEKLGSSSSLQVPVGSLSLSQFVDVVGVPEPDKVIDLLVCVKPKYLNTSESDTDRKLAAGWERGGLSKHRLLVHLGRYARERELTLSFPSDPRPGSEVSEETLRKFEAISGAKCQLVGPMDLPQSPIRLQPDSTLWTILHSRVVVGVNTSLLWDSVALRVPTVYSSYGESSYNWFPPLGKWVMHEPNYTQLAIELDEARQVTRAELEARAELLNPYLRDPTTTSAASFLKLLIHRSLDTRSLDDALNSDDIVRDSCSEI